MVRVSTYNLANTFNELSIELTHRCTLNCIYCSSNSSLNNSIFLKLSKLMETIKNVKKRFKINTISLSGGESFLHPDFLKLLKFLAGLKINLIIYTSGVLIDENNNLISLTEDIIDSICDIKDRISVVFNIQGHNRELIENINRVPNSFNIIRESIEKLRNKGILIEANVVPIQRNYKFLEDIAWFCYDENFTKIHFLRFVPQGRGNNPNLHIDNKKFKEINLKLIKILEDKKLPKRMEIRIGNPCNFLFLLNNNNLFKLKKNHFCRGGFDAPLIIPNGDVSMCPAWKNLKQFNIGNIYTHKFEDLWFSKNFQILRKFIEKGYKNLREPCRSCNFLTVCRGKCVAQRFLCQKDINEKNMDELLYYAPDPNCFKKLITFGDENSKIKSKE